MYGNEYTTDLELDFIRGLFRNNRHAFLTYAKTVMHGKRSYDPQIRVALIRHEIIELVKVHRQEVVDNQLPEPAKP